MAVFPTSIVSFREKENLPGLEFDAENKKTFFVEDLQKIEDEVIGIEETLGEEILGDAETVADRLNAIIYNCWPVGSVYINGDDDRNPATILGMPDSEWVAWGVGKAIVGIDTGDTDFDTANETGGEKAHTLTSAEMPSHTHTQDAHRHQPSNTSYLFLAATGNIAVNGTRRAFPATGSSGYMVYAPENETINEYDYTNSVTATNNNTGGDVPHNNLQPYQVGYVWKRIS